MPPPGECESCCTILEVQRLDLEPPILNTFESLSGISWASYPFGGYSLLGETAGYPGHRSPLLGETLYLNLGSSITEKGKLMWVIGNGVGDGKQSYFGSCARSLADVACPSDYNDCWYPANATSDRQLNLSVRCAGPLGIPLCNSSAPVVPMWGWALCGLSFSTALLLVLQRWCFSEGFQRWYSNGSIVLGSMAFCFFLLYLPLQFPGECITYVWYPFLCMVFTELVLTAAWLSSRMAITARLLTSTHRFLVGALTAAYIMPGPCAMNKVSSQHMEINHIQIHVRADNILPHQSIYPYICVLGGVLIWIPEWATRVSSRATLQRWVRRPKAPMPPAVLDSSPIPNAAEQEAPANAPTNFRSKCKQEIKHHLLMIAVTACVCIPLGLWDSMAVADLLNQARFCRTRLQELAWAGPAVISTSMTDTLLPDGSAQSSAVVEAPLRVEMVTAPLELRNCPPSDAPAAESPAVLARSQGPDTQEL